jgi:hypothetical protein
VCKLPNFGLSTQAVAPQLSYPRQGELSKLPSLDKDPKPEVLKVFVAKVYDSYPIFKQVYERDLKLTRTQALAFMYADMDRESAGNHPSTGAMVWKVDLETGNGDPKDSARAWGPFQAAITNYIGGGYDDQILNASGLPTPTMADFYNPSVSTFTGMKRLLEGIIKAREYFGPNKEVAKYLLGTLAHHNTGWVNATEQATWLTSYGYEVLQHMQAFQAGDNMTNSKIFYTGQKDICQ